MSLKSHSKQTPLVETLEHRRLLSADYTGSAAGSQAAAQAEQTVSFKASSAATATKILFLGDSITAGEAPHATYRYWLYQQLISSGYNVDFIGPYNWIHGSSWSGYVTPGATFDWDHYSHAGRTVENILASLQWDDPSRTLYVPDIAVIMAGNNDLAANRGVNATIASMSALIDELRLRNPNVKIVLTQLLPNIETPEREALTAELNAQIPVLAASKTTAASPIVVVDQFTGFNVHTDTYDAKKVHPNEAGEKKIAAKYATALKELMGGTTVPPTGNLRGTVFLDSNKNGVRDADEPGIPGRFVFLDYNNNGRREQDEPITVTSKLGNYLFRDLPAGTYLVRHYLGVTAKASDPVESIHQADVAGIPTTSYEFGVTLLSRISGFVFKDYDGDGARNGWDYNLAGRYVYIDSNNNGRFDQGEPVTVTSSIGRYMFSDLPPGDYTIRVVTAAVEYVSSPSNSIYFISFNPGEYYNGATFGLVSR